jgi:hypothetical protein
MKKTNALAGRILIGIFLVAAALAVRYADLRQPHVVAEVINSDQYGAIDLARPSSGSRNLVLVYADTKKYQAQKLAARLAEGGDAAAIVDTGRTLQTLTAQGCLDAGRIMEPLALLSNWAKAAGGTHSILAGLEDGSLLPLLASLTDAGGANDNLSVGFSAKIPAALTLCPPLTTGAADPQGLRLLTSAPPLKGKWLAAWADQPAPETGVFVRGLAGAQTTIAPYDTPLDSILIGEIGKIGEKADGGRADSWPVVEVPSPSANTTVTLFYSGDGGWRDLDRALAGIMAERGYPVVGVDTLRAFWSGKSPSEAAKELSAIMAYYRTAWKAQKFILAGYSFGADIMPAVYNLLPENDRESVPLLVLLALGKNADFEIHVSGWMGKSSDGLPIQPELSRIPGNKILCIFGTDEKAESSCPSLSATGAHLLELPGGHHFDQDYSKLAGRIIDIFQQSGISSNH